MRWSRLQGLIYDIWLPELRLQIHCNAYPLSGSSCVGRYWVTLDKQIIWDCPKDFSEECAKGAYNDVATRIGDLRREYLDTPKAKLMTAQFATDGWGLIDLFRAADRRIGKAALTELRRVTRSAPAKLVLERRLGLSGRAGA